MDQPLPTGSPSARPVRRGESSRGAVARRVLAALILIPPILWAAGRGGPIFLVVVLAAAGIACREFLGMASARGLAPSRVLSYLAVLALPLVVYLDLPFGPALVVTATVVLATALRMGPAGGGGSILEGAGVTLLGVLYVGWLASYLILLREFPAGPEAGRAIGAAGLFLALALTWAHDTGAYVVGMLVGRHAMIPRVSPGKTWEGALGGLVACVAAAVVARAAFAGFLSLPAALAIGVGGALAAVVGDLVASMMKRGSNMKDTGTFLPGHGGLLDRIDSLLFVTPVVFYALVLFVL